MISELCNAHCEYEDTSDTPTTLEARRAKRRLKAALVVAHQMLDRGWRRIADESLRARVRAKCDDVFEKLEYDLLELSVYSAPNSA